MKILVNGGAGYIGSHITVELFATGHTPIMGEVMRDSWEWQKTL